MNKSDLPCEQKVYGCGIFIYRELYDAALARTNEKYPPPRNPERPRDLLSWHRFYRIFLESLPLLAQEQEVELIRRWQQNGDQVARDYLVVSLARIVGPIAGRMVTRRFPKLSGDGWLEAVHEIIGWGNLGLVDAPSKITLSRGFRLSTVANQWIRKYAHDGLASLVSVIHYPERKRSLAKFDSQLAVPVDDGEVEAFDSFGNPANPDMKLGYLQRQVGKRLFPWHDWGTYWPLLGVPSRFEIPGGVSLDAQGDRAPSPDPFENLEFTRGKREILNDYRTRREEYGIASVPPGATMYGPDFYPVVTEAGSGTSPRTISWLVTRINGKDWRHFLPHEVCYIDKRQGRYCSWQHYSKPKQVAQEIVGLVQHVSSEMRYLGENWHDAVPGRRQLDGYRDWDDHGNRIDKVRRYSVPRRPIEYAAHTADGLPPAGPKVKCLSKKHVRPYALRDILADTVRRRFTSSSEIVRVALLEKFERDGVRVISPTTVESLEAA